MFKEELSASMGKFLMENEHKMIVAAKDCIYFVKRYSDILAFYIRCKDKRNRGGGIKVDFFFMPIVIPNDDVFLSGAGVCIKVFPEGGICEGDVMLSAGRKIVALEGSMDKFSDIILRELENPFFPNGKLPVNTITFIIYNKIREDKNMQQEFGVLKKDVCKLMKGKKTKEAYQQCHDFMKRLPSVYFESNGISINPNIDGKRFAEQIYAQHILGA